MNDGQMCEPGCLAHDLQLEVRQSYQISTQPCMAIKLNIRGIFASRVVGIVMDRECNSIMIK